MNPTPDQLNELKHRAQMLRLAADERARAMTSELSAKPAGFEARDIYMDSVAQFAEAVVAILDPMTLADTTGR